MLKKIIPILFMIVALLALVLLPVGLVSAAPTALTFTVNSTLDQPDDLTIPGTCHTSANTCTLRAAIMQANRATGLGAIILLPAGIYSLTISFTGSDGEANGDLNLTTPATGSPKITITGAGAGSTIIDANQIDRVFHVHPGRVAAISDVTIRNGYYVPNVNAYGGGVYNEGSLTMINSTISANKAASYGGGISNSNIGILSVINSTIRQNYADFAGGGIYNEGSLDVLNSTLSENTARKAGGGVANGGNGLDTGRMKMSKSTIYGNGSNDGGGIYSSNLNLFVINSTISQNYANNNGGGIYASKYSLVVALYNTTIIDNDSDHDRDQLGGIGGGVYSQAGSRFIVVNTLIAGNTILNAPIYNDCDGTLEAYGQNLLGDKSGCTIPNVLNAGLISLSTIGPFQYNGGPTQTYALLADSVAIDTTIDSLGCVDETGAQLTTDQRGSPRPMGPRCDVGAFEYSPLRYVYLPLTLR
jgi:predicted outer membrane repeat protein